MAELLYALRKTDNKIINISEIPQNLQDRHSSEWECVCPFCGKPVYAKKGSKREHHFAHYSDMEKCNIVYANQTAIHLMAKEIIAEEKKFAVPPIEIPWEDLDLKTDDPEVLDYLEEIDIYQHSRAALISCSDCILEKSLSGIIPDIIAKTKYGDFLIEIFVSHAVDPEKIAKTEALKLPMLQIDLSEYKDKEITRTELKRILLTRHAHTEWICYPSPEKLLDGARTYYNKEYLRLKKETAEQKRRQEEKEKWKLQKKEASTKEFIALMQPSEYSKRLKSLRDDNTFKQAANEFRFFRPEIEWPFYLDIPITGEMVFKCDRRIWQGYLFHRWIYNRKEKGSLIPVTTYENHLGIFDAIMNQKEIPIPVDKSLMYSFSVNLFNRQKIHFPTDVIFKYLQYLSNLGFITYSFGYGEALNTCCRTLTPPNLEYAAELQKALKTVDLLSPDIDFLIGQALKPFYEQKKKETAELKATQMMHDQVKDISPLHSVSENSIQEETYIEHAIASHSSNKAEETAARKSKYEIGKTEIENCDFSQPLQIWDQFNWRWGKCKICGEIVREDETSQIKYGQCICKKCSAIKIVFD